MSLNDILDSLFPAGHAVAVNNQVMTGEAMTAQGTVAVLGTTDAAAIDHAMALALSGFILDTIEQHPGRPLVFLVDTSGQALSTGRSIRTSSSRPLQAAHLPVNIRGRAAGSRSANRVAAITDGGSRPSCRPQPVHGVNRQAGRWSR